MLKNWCFWTVVWEKTLESPLEWQEIKPVNLKRSQPWIVIGRTIAAVPIIWLPNGKSHLFGKDPDTGKDWEQEVKGTTEDEMAGWHHGLDGRESEWTPGDGDEQGGPAIHGVAKRQTRLSNWTELNWLTAFRILLLTCLVYSISSKGFLPTVVDIMVIWIKLAHSSPFYFIDS